jgi:nitrite reductase (NO-forming)
VDAVLTDAPAVPPPIIRRTPARVRVHLDVVETTRTLADNVRYTQWTYGGRVPGKFIRVRQGDLVDLTLRNRTGNMMPHNIDLHAVTGPGGGGMATMTAPGDESTFEWQARKAGIFVYHCATAPVPMHVANGMFGLILVEPPGGLAPMDHEYYIMQSEWYTQHAPTGPAGNMFEYNGDKMLAERPDYVTWNGGVGALTGSHALQAKVGDRVRLFVGNAGPNLICSFHIIGSHLEKVYDEGSLDSPPLLNIQTQLISPGSAMMTETLFPVPGNYAMIDHALGRAFGKGAVGTLHVDGPEQPAIFWSVGSKTSSGTVAALPAAPTGFRPAQASPMAMCANCHDLSPARKHLVGPGLFGVYGRAPSVTGVPFKTWDAAALDRWLTNATAVKPNTTMTYRVNDAKQRGLIIDALRALH